MTDFIYFMLQSSLLIILVLIVRRAGKRYISARAVYGLWLIPMARLLFPFALVSVMLPPALCGLHPYAVVQEAAKGAAAAAARMDGREEGTADDFQTGQLLGGAVNGESAGKEDGAAGIGQMAAAGGEGMGQAVGQPAESSLKGPGRSGRETKAVPDAARRMGPGLWAVVIWAAGGLATAAIFLYKNIRFFKWLKSGRRKVELPGALAESLQKRGGLPDIYYRKGLRSPCLAGIVHPAVFLNERAMRDEETLKMVLLHEQMHYRQKDHIWNLCRNLMCIVYWFHPLVWRGAAMSMQDAELACDERVVKDMGKKERRSYGTVLLDLLDGNGRGAKALDAATAMTGGRKEIEKRIYGIARRRRTRNGVLAAGLILLLGAGVVGCTRVRADGGSSGGILPQQETPGADRAQGADGGDGGYSAFAETEASEELAGEGKNAPGQQDGEEETEVPKREALFSSATPIGSVELVYKDEEIMIFTGYFGLAVFRYGEGAGECGVTDTLDLSAIGCDRIGGDSAGMIRASRDGTQIYMRAGNGRDVYHYDRAQGKLYRVGLSAWPSEEALYAAEEEEAYGWDANKSAEIGNLFVSRRRAGSEEKLPFWNEGTKAYMKALKARYDRGERELIVDEGWNGAYPAEPEPVRDLGGVEGQWRRVISCVDENGDKIENPYEYPAWFERMDGSKKLSVRSFDELICSWGDLLFYRYDKTIWVTRSDAVNPFFSLPEGDGSIELYTAGKELGAYRHGRENSGTLTFYDSRFNVVKQYSNVRLEEFSESYYCLMDLDTGLYGYADDSGELAIPFSYSLAKGFHNGYAAVLTGAEAEIYYEDHTDKMFNQIGGFWGIINKKGNYVIEPDEKYSNSFERGDLEGTTARYINGPVGFLEVREDKTADFIRWEDQKVLYTVTIPEETPEF